MARCVRLGIVLAQLACYPQTRAFFPFCPRRRDSGKRLVHTGLRATQVLDGPAEKRVVHTARQPLLLRLCIYKNFNKKTGENFRGRRTGALPQPEGSLARTVEGLQPAVGEQGMAERVSRRLDEIKRPPPPCQLSDALLEALSASAQAMRPPATVEKKEPASGAAPKGPARCAVISPPKASESPPARPQTGGG